MPSTEIRPARFEDENELVVLDRANWSTLVSPAPLPPDEKPFFDERCRPENVLVAVRGGSIVGYIRVDRATDLPASDHVAHVNGLVVAGSERRQGIGRALMEEAIGQLGAHGRRRMTLRVLGHNDGARRLYETCGFVVEGVLRGEFFLDGDYVDDVLMARDIERPAR